MNIFPPLKTVPAKLIGLTLKISDETLVKIKELEREDALAMDEFIKNPIIFD